MHTKKIIYRLISGVIYLFIGYLFYELAREVFFKPDSTVIQRWMSAFFTILVLLVLMPLSSFFWRCDEKGILMVLTFIGALTIASLTFSVTDFLWSHLESAPSIIRLFVSLTFLIAPFCLSIGFYRWATKKMQNKAQ